MVPRAYRRPAAIVSRALMLRSASSARASIRGRPNAATQSGVDMSMKYSGSLGRRELPRARRRSGRGRTPNRRHIFTGASSCPNRGRPLRGSSGVTSAATGLRPARTSSSSRDSDSGRSTLRWQAFPSATGSTTCRVHRARMRTHPLPFASCLRSTRSSSRIATGAGSCHPSTPTRSSTRRTRRRRTRSRSTASSPVRGESRRSASPSSRSHRYPRVCVARSMRRPSGCSRGTRLEREERQLGLALAAENREVDLDAVDAAALGERDRLRLDLLCDEVAAAGGCATGRRGCSRGSG